MKNYKDSLPYFVEIASRGIPVREPAIVQAEARTSLFKAYQDFVTLYPDTILGVTRPACLSHSLWRDGIASGMLQADFCREKLKEVWAKNPHPHGCSPDFSGSIADMTLLEEADGFSGFAGEVLKLFKKRARVAGICGQWLSTYKEGRLYYESLHPFGCSTGRCAPCASEGFLPSMGKDLVKALLCPAKGKAVSILDFRSQGICIASALSGDAALKQVATAKKDSYLGLGKILGVIPASEYDTLPVSELKEKFHAQREMLKKLTISYQYGAGEGRLSSIFGKSGIKAYLDSLFRVYSKWCKEIHTTYALPDGFISSARSGSVAHVQGTDAYILREIVSSYPYKDAPIIATNHDCLWVEHENDFDPTPIATFMESVANGVCGVDGFFKVTIETVRGI